MHQFKIAICATTLSLLAVLPVSVMASEIAVRFDDNSQNALLQLPAALDQCVAGATVHGDYTACKALSGFLAGLVNETRAAQQAAVAKAASDKAAADAAAKKAADDAVPRAAERPADAPN